MPADARGRAEGILKGMYVLQADGRKPKAKLRAQLLRQRRHPQRGR